MAPSRQELADAAIQRRSFLKGLVAVGAYGSLGGGVAAALAGCGGSSSGGGTGAASKTKVLNVGVFQNPDSLDPGATGLVTVSQILYSVFDTLMWRIGNDPTLLPGLANSVSVSPDATTYTFALKKNVKFHDGTPFTADAVKATFDHIVNPATKSLSAIGSLGPYKETQVVDPYTARVVFSAPNAAFMSEMTDATLGISSPTALTKYGSSYDLHPVGTGPFVFQQFINNDRVVVSRNPDYAWGPAALGGGKPALLESITFRILPDPSSQANALSTGEIQVAQNLNPGDVLSAVSGGKKKITAPATGMPYCILVNAQKPPTDELPVRQALEYAVDSQSIIDTLFQGLYQRADSVLTPVTSGYSSRQALYRHDPKKAASLLDAAGWKMGSGGIRSRGGQSLSVEFINISNFGFDGISQLIQAQMHAVGIQSTITDQAFPSVSTTYDQGKQNLADWFYYDVDPYLFNTVFSSTQIASGFNWAHYANPAVDAAIAAANADTNASSRAAKYEDIALTLMQSATVIPLYNLETIMVGASGLTGVQFSLTAQPLFHQAS